MKRRVTFLVDNTRLFDAVNDVGDGGIAVGSRLVQALLDEPGSAELVGLEYYGISIPGVTPEVFKAADEARTTYLRDVDCNDQMGALHAALEAAFKCAN